MSESTTFRTDFRRREFLQTVLSTAVVGATAQAGLGLSFPCVAHAQSNITPESGNTGIS
jgi:hypothetical protein